MPNSNNPVGVVIIARHGDRTAYYQNPETYDSTDTVLTALGEQQNYQMGQMMRRIYAGADPSRAIAGLSNTTFVDSAISSMADAGGEGSVIYDSALAFWQGFYPPNPSASDIALANGSQIVSPLNGYQYVKVETVLPADDIDFEPWTNCAVWTNQTSGAYASPQFTAKAAEAQGILDTIKNSGIVGDRSVTLKNIYNVWDYMNVNSIHNATFAAKLNETSPTLLAQAHDLANFHEYSLFSASSADGLGNLPGRALFPRLISHLQAFTESGNKLYISHLHMSYKPFISIMNMTNIAASTDPVFEYPYAMVDYASSMTLELRHGGSGSSGYDVRLGFRNSSSADGDLTYYPLFGTNDVDMDLDTFVSKLQPALVQNNTDWCSYCQNNGSVATCSEWALAQKYETLAASYKHQSDSHFTSVGSGFIGACVTLVVGAVVLAALRGLGWVSFGKRAGGRRGESDRYPLTDRESFKGSVASHM
ncbi:hypothetical protein BMF94_0609 [Rhodotorula taiwanensis]|uniref:Acid phosphatase n=1 Tax=Rhodotorula taiwanensis TaxID=741276 RepID=A0A2S5BI15_9BASI|nr:hypothetical protein BMF94_0609 [Rhodotorula taiwanensis]